MLGKYLKHLEVVFASNMAKNMVKTNSCTKFKNFSHRPMHIWGLILIKIWRWVYFHFYWFHLILKLNWYLRDLESTINSLSTPPAPLTLGNTAFLTQELSQDRQALYSQLVNSYKWIDKVKIPIPTTLWLAIHFSEFYKSKTIVGKIWYIGSWLWYSCCDRFTCKHTEAVIQ